MTKAVVEHLFKGPTQTYADVYDSKFTILGQYMQQKNGAVHPLHPTALRFLEAGIVDPNFDGWHPWAIDVGNDTHWVFFTENKTTDNTNKVLLTIHNTATNEWQVQGWLNCTWPSAASTQTCRGFAVYRYLHTSGRIMYNDAASTTVYGNTTTWSDSRIAAGARIGFGSKDPAQIKHWYEISAITDNTTLTLTAATLNGIPPHSEYVIEELRIYNTRGSGATVAGLFVAKGINFFDFKSDGSVTIASATTTDNLKRCYWLADASTVQNTFGAGLCLSDTWTDTEQYCYIPDAATNSMRIYKHNVRAAISALSSGKQGSPFASYICRTNTTAAGSNLVTDRNVWTIATTNHGPAAGEEAIYGAHASGSYASCIPTKNIVDGATNVITGFFRENLPTGTGGLSTGSAVYGLDYDATLDRFVLSASSSGIYSFKFVTDGRPYEKRMLVDHKHVDKRATGVYAPPTPSTRISGEQVTLHTLNGMLYTNKYFTSATTATVLNSIAHVVPIGIDWDSPISSKYQNKLVSPEILTPRCRKFNFVSILHSTKAGSNALGFPTAPYKVYYRTAGISDDTGGWNLLSADGNLNGVGAASSIQFMFMFKTIDVFAIPAKIYGVQCSYEEEGTDIHFQPSVNFSNKNTKTFAWKFATAFDGSVTPTLTVKIYESVTGVLLLKDTTTASLFGTFQKSINGGQSWISYNVNNKTNEKTYIRYVTTALADNLKVKVVLTQ
jgi:hypothetical protein